MSLCPSAVEFLDCNLRAIHPCAWSLHYHRFALSFGDIEDLLAERGVAVPHETIRAKLSKPFNTPLTKTQFVTMPTEQARENTAAVAREVVPYFRTADSTTAAVE